MPTATISCDEELAAAARDGDEPALHELVEIYRPMIRAMAAERFIPGGDREDLIQEGMVGLWHAIRDHDAERGPFGPFARLCVDRQMWAAVTKANRIRHRFLHDCAVYEDWMDIADDSADPEQITQAGETARQLNLHIRAALTDLEQDVLAMYTAGRSYDDIAGQLAVHRKRIDNALQRARRKILAFQSAQMV